MTSWLQELSPPTSWTILPLGNEPAKLEQVVAGVAERLCSIWSCCLIGGETAEMPGMYGEDDYDLAGFAVGFAEKSEVIDGFKVAGRCPSGAGFQRYPFKRLFPCRRVLWTIRVRKNCQNWKVKTQRKSCLSRLVSMSRLCCR